MTEPQRVAILGAGGFAREVAWLIREINEAQPAPAFDFRGFIVSDLGQLGPTDSADRVLGDLSWIEANSDALDAIVIGIGSPAVRLRLGLEIAERFASLALPSLIHPTVRIDRSTLQLGAGIIICAGVIGTVNIRIDDFALINLGCTLGHETTIGRAAVLNPSVNLSGGVSIGDAVLLGTGAQVLQYLRIEERAVVGAGAVVLKGVPRGTTVIGIPAKPL